MMTVSEVGSMSERSSSAAVNSGRRSTARKVWQKLCTAKNFQSARMASVAARVSGEASSRPCVEQPFSERAGSRSGTFAALDVRPIFAPEGGKRRLIWLVGASDEHTTTLNAERIDESTQRRARGIKRDNQFRMGM